MAVSTLALPRDEGRLSEYLYFDGQIEEEKAKETAKTGGLAQSVVPPRADWLPPGLAGSHRKTCREAVIALPAPPTLWE
jgi:hypothetical protein